MTVGIVGMGYVGLPLAVAFAEAGCKVVAVEVDPRRVDALKRSESYVEDIPSERLAAASGRIAPTGRYADLAQVQAIIICVPTPLTVNREPDLGPLISSAEAIADHLQVQQLVVLESTTYPGTTRERLLPILQRSGMAAGSDFHLAFSPERVDPGRVDHTLRTTPKVFGGLTEECAARARDLYSHVCDHLVEVSSPEAAELTKLLENIFRSVNIALVNELAMLTHRMGINIWEVVDAAATKPYGFMRFDPGPGMGGHCLPVDPFYLSWRAREFDFATEFVELAGKTNQNMPYFCVERIEEALNSVEKSVRNSRVAILGVSYKAGVGDMRESPALKIMRLLEQRGAQLGYHDPHIPELPEFGLSTEALDHLVEKADITVIVTAHPHLDHSKVAAEAGLVLDLRGVTRDMRSNSVLLL